MASEDDEPQSVDAAAEVRRAAGRDFDFEILSVGHWVRRRMVADRYGKAACSSPATPCT